MEGFQYTSLPPELVSYPILRPRLTQIPQSTEHREYKNKRSDAKSILYTSRSYESTNRVMQVKTKYS